MTTAVISDLHLGSPASCLGDPVLRRTLVDALAGVERLVLLGDVLALRAGPVREVLERAAPFLDEIAGCMSGRRIVIVPGNHDHQLAEPLLDELCWNGGSGRLGLEVLFDSSGSGLLGSIARRLGDIELTLAYPGIWLRPDLYATHGHYLDCHATVPRMESVLASAMTALHGGMPEEGVEPERYESALAPIYAFAYRCAQASLSPTATGALRTRLWRRLRIAGWKQLEAGSTATRGRPRPPSSLAFAAAVAVLNRTGLGPFQAHFSVEDLGEAGFRAMAEVADRLGIKADYVLFGHTHRVGPLAGERERRSATGASLVNTGSWVYSRTLIGDSGSASAYWPGTCVFVDSQGPPRLESLLRDLPVRRHG